MEGIMGTVYKIHPAIGIARVGNHPTAFFIGPESPGVPGMDFGTNGAEMPITQYKEGGRIKRQAARFRVFRFHQDDTGNLQLVGEVTADDAQIEWKADLCNRKAALDRNPEAHHPAQPRNMDIADRDSLIIKNAQPVTISGRNKFGNEFKGRFLSEEVYLGELRTDSKGRLLVLGGRGVSGSPSGAALTEFANNDGWHDDVSDGPVTAIVTLQGQDPVVVHHPSWVTVAPPDFAPAIDSIVTLYEVAFQAAIEKGALQPEPLPSFRRHIKPLIERAANLRWVNDFNLWKSLASVNWTTLASTSAADAAARLSVAKRLKNPGLRDFVMPAYVKRYVDQWVEGNFHSDLNDTDPAVPTPDQTDRAALEACVGNNFFPGIEASINLRDKDIYARPFRLDHTNIGKVYPGCLSEIMAVPWQADFIECGNGVWWPSQRPYIAMTRADDVPGSQAKWAAPLGDLDHQGMVDHAQQFGFIVPEQVNGHTIFVERERDQNFPRAPLVAMAGGGNAPPAKPA
jgi:hypothetical protein